MKHFITTIVALIFTLGLFAQETTTTAEEPEISKAKETVNKAKDRLVFELNSGYLIHDDATGFKPKGFQRGLNIYFMYDVVIKKSPISIAPGAGIGTEHWFHNSAIGFTDTFTSFTPFADSIDNKRSKLGLTYFDVPIELRFRSKPNAKNMSWKLAAGFKIGFLIHSGWKYKGEEFRDIRLDSKDVIKFKEIGIPNLEKIRYGATLRGGYGPFNLHVYYSLSSIFEDGKSLDLQPIVFGISINGL